MMQSRLALLAAVALTTACTLARAEALQTAGKVDAVTVYRGQALVTRTVDVKGPAGLREVVVTDLPARVQPGSVFAEGGDGIEVRSVLFRERAVADDVREEVRKLQQQIENLGFVKSDLEREAGTIAAYRAYLDKLENFTAANATNEMKSAILDPERIAKLSQFLFDERAKLASRETDLQKKQAQLAKDTDLAQRQLDELTRSSSKSVREAVIFVNLPNPDAQIRVRYLVDSATWQPSYTLRAESPGKPALLTYNAAIQQTTGEDWADVDMILSTATPALVARGPELDALRVTLASPQAVAQPVEVLRGQLQQQQLGYEALRNTQHGQGWGGSAGGRDRDKAAFGFASSNAAAEAQLNDVAGRLQVLEFAQAAAKASREEREAKHRADAETISVTYKMSNRSTLPSRADQQLVTLASHALPASFYKVATPVLTKAVYNEASLTNDTGVVLLAGPVSSYMAGEFVGSGQIPTVSAGEAFAVGFGIDPSLRVSRELVDKTETVQGGNKVTRFDYEISLENFGSDAADVRVLDRLPVSSGPEVRATLLSAQPSVVPQPENTFRKNGQLRWDVKVEPNAVGTKAAKVAYTLQLEHDRNMAVTTASGGAAQ